MMTIDEISHKIATYAIEQQDSTNLYTAVKTKTLELLGESTEEVNLILSRHETALGFIKVGTSPDAA